MEPQYDSTVDRDANAIIEGQLDLRLESIEKAASADVLTIIGPMYQVIIDDIKHAIESIEEREGKLLIILETPGGYVSVVERIARIFRHHYRHVEFLVPSHAMSAGTVLVMSGDAIHMDYASVLGPIDPQLQKDDGTLVPALGYLEQYKRLVKKSADGTMTNAELMYLIQRFDPAELYQYEQERELSIALLEQWLVNYKFKNWKTTATRKKKVTVAMRKKRAKDIAEKLNQVDHWHSHSRGIPMETLQKDLKLVIDDYGKDPKLSSAVAGYYYLLKDYTMRRAHHVFVIHRRGDYVGY